MNTKEKIECLERVLELEKKRYKFLDFSEVKECILSITDLLQCGEKYKEMWEELEKHKCLLVDFDNEGYFKRNYFLSEIKQKYFPELVKKYITIEVESKNEREVDAGMEDIKELVDNMQCPKMKIANQWKEEL